MKTWEFGRFAVFWHFSRKKAPLRQLEKSESHRQCHSKILDGAAQDQPVAQSRGELSRSKPTRGRIGDGKKLQIQALLHWKESFTLGMSPVDLGKSFPSEEVQRFEAQLKSSTDLQQKLHLPSDKTLLCHCAPTEPCHGDVLISSRLETQTSQTTKQLRQRNSSAQQR